MKVKIRNLLPVLVNGRGDIFVGRAGEQEYVDIHQLKDRAKDFLLNVMDDPNLPEKEVEEFELPTAANGAIRSEKAYSRCKRPKIPNIRSTSWYRTS